MRNGLSLHIVNVDDLRIYAQSESHLATSLAQPNLTHVYFCASISHPICKHFLSTVAIA